MMGRGPGVPGAAPGGGRQGPAPAHGYPHAPGVPV